MPYPTELKHVGVLGMRWGVRKSSRRQSRIRNYDQYMRRESIDEYLSSKGKKIPLKMSNKKMQKIEKEMHEDLKKAKKQIGITLGVIGGLGAATLIAKYFGVGG